MPVIYPPPLDRLLTLGRPDLSAEWLDYRALGLGDEHVPALIELIQDPQLEWAACGEGDDETPFWARVHAWRALGQLRAADAAEPLAGVLLRDTEDEWAPEEIPEALGMIGPVALPAIRDAFPDAARAPEPWVVGSLGAALRQIATAHPEVRDEVVAVLTDRLRLWREQDATMNAFLISDLVEMGVVEAAPVMQEAFENGVVDESVVGDWEDVQVELGLLARRTRPRSRFELGPDPVFRDFEPAPVRAAQRSTKAAAKARNRRKTAKQSRKKNRRRR
ncbi:MAG TPA: hypothetical protein VHG08_22050 [Longimicrobium sp.]|nr:hypothetical protein [Longimicrobium sp.]